MIRIAFAILFTAIILTACGGPKKCNGKKGTRVEMGRM